MSSRAARHEYVIVDVFGDAPLEGNPAAVFTDAAGLDAATMQRAARELNLSETVFLTPGDGNGDSDGADVRARIFTPNVELPFAGHPVLGAAFVVGRALDRELVRIATGAGVIPVRLRRQRGRPVHGEMDQPIPSWEPFADPERLFAALGVPGSQLPVDVYVNGPRHAFVALAEPAAVAALTPDLPALAALGALGVSCLAMTGPHEVKTRMFGPAIGVAEDPATGSAAGPLALHLARHRVIGFGERVTISQGVELGRPSTLEAVAEGGADEVSRVAVAGGAVIVAEGHYRLR